MVSGAAAIRNCGREGVNLTRIAGVDDGWSVPVSLWHGPQGFDSSCKPDNKPHHTVAVRLSGSLVRLVNASRSPLEQLPRDGFSIHPAGHDWRFVATSEIRFAHLHIPDEYLRAVSHSFKPKSQRESDLLRDDRVMFRDDEMRHEIASYIERAFDNDDVPCRLEMDSRAALIVLHLLKRHSAVSDHKTGAAGKGTLAPWQVKTACEFMTDNLGTDICLIELAKLVGTSQEHFCRAFRKSVGLPPYRWLQKRRIAHAQVLLSNRDLSLTDVAQRVGYMGQSAFGAAFRKETGMTPSQFRRRA
jgi:AraC family transcriptional regulator